MASNEAVYGLKLIWRAIASVAMFQGRSRRTELFYYWLAAAILSALLPQLADLLLRQFAEEMSWRQERIVSATVDLLCGLPFFALFARRLHDQDRSAWWVLILPPLLAMNIYKSLRFILLDPQAGAATLPDLAWWLTLLGGPLALASVILFLLPGTNGPNRYGPDPRDDDPRAQRLPSDDANLSSRR